MRNLSTVLHYMGIVLIAFAFLQAVPLIISAIYVETVEFPFRIYALPAAVSAVLGVILVIAFKPRLLTGGTAMAICALGWITLSLIGAVPYWLALKITYLDAFFETVSGFTTTGITLFQGLDWLPHSILFWRSFTQWIGGLGIFTFFLLVAFHGRLPSSLFLAESPKVSSKRIAPGLFTSLRILWMLYITLSALCSVLLWLEGLNPFDAVVHALSTVSTAGFSSHDASIGFFQNSGYPHYVAIEYTIILFMFLGGTSFLVYWYAIKGRWRNILRNSELRLWVLLLIGATLLISWSNWNGVRSEGLHTHLRTSLFQVVSIATTTGFGTRDIASAAFSPFTKQVFLLLMVIGGCVGSTAGGVKVLRIGILSRSFFRQLRMPTYPSRAVVPFVVDGEIIGSEEVQLAGAIFFSWVALLVIGGLLMAFLTDFGALESFSGAFSALGNVGPSFITQPAFAGVGSAVKVFYILGMLAGRLEILPLFLIFSRRTWN